MHLSKVLMSLIVSSAVSFSVYAEASVINAASDKHLLYGYSQVMIQQNINPSVYRGTFWKFDNLTTAITPRNFRTVCDQLDLAHTKKLKDNYIPSLQGLAASKMSGSAEFDAYQIAGLKAAIRKYHQGKICVVDLRQESHFLVNGRSISWYGLRDWGNVGKNIQSVQTAEEKLAEMIQGRVIDIYNTDASKQPCRQELIQAADVKSEEEIVTSHGLAYYRLPCTDHVCPTAEEIDTFIAFVKNLDSDTWLHFHCEAGDGRTTFFMALYDMLQNPTVQLKDIAYRQDLIGGNNILQTSAKDWREVYFKEKALNAPLIYQYIQENHKTHYAKTFREWSSLNMARITVLKSNNCFKTAIFKWRRL